MSGLLFESVSDKSVENIGGYLSLICEGLFHLSRGTKDVVEEVDIAFEVVVDSV